jgi:hypothetical protein
MRTIKLKQILLLLVAGFFVFFIGTNTVKAADDEVPTSCINDLGWTTTLQGISLASCIDDENKTFDCYIWTYKVQNPSNNTKGLNHINFNISSDPHWESPPATWIAQYDSSATVTTYPAGLGEPANDFGKGILQDYVVKFTPQSSDGTWSFVSNANQKRKGTVGLKINNSLGLCEIGVPYEAEYAAMAVSSEQIITTTDNKKFKILEDPYTQCILKAQYWDGDSWVDMTKSEIYDSLELKEGGISEPIEYVGVPGQGCPRAIIKREGPETYFFISGRWVWKP